MIDPRLREDGVTITDPLLRQFAAIWLAVVAWTRSRE